MGCLTPGQEARLERDLWADLDRWLHATSDDDYRLGEDEPEDPDWWHDEAAMHADGGEDS